MDEVKPQDLSLSFLREFMNLPNSYFEPGAPLKYREQKNVIFNNFGDLLQELEYHPSYAIKIKTY